MVEDLGRIERREEYDQNIVYESLKKRIKTTFKSYSFNLKILRTTVTRAWDTGTWAILEIIATMCWECAMGICALKTLAKQVL